MFSTVAGILLSGVVARLRRTLDLIAALVLLRATIFTRVTGDAAIPRQRAMVVPVGRIGTEEMVLSLGQSVSQFLQESAVFLREDIPPQQRVLIDKAQRAVREVFRNFRWMGQLPNRNRRSVVIPAQLTALASRVCAAVAPLLEELEGVSLP